MPLARPARAVQFVPVAGRRRCDPWRHLLLLGARHTSPSATVARHQIFIEALQAKGVTVGLGNFKAKDIYQPVPPAAHIHFKRHEEKETDVNIAVSSSRWSPTVAATP